MNAASHNLTIVQDDDPLLDNPQAAKFLKRSESWLNQSRMRGEGPVWVRVGERGVGYLLSDLREYVRARRQVTRTTPEAA